MYEVIGESVKSATSIKLGEIFGEDTKRYKEAVTKMTYPNFFIYQVSANIIPNTQNRWHIDYLMNIRYRVAEDTTNLTTLEQELDKVALKLMAEFTEIQLERPIFVRNARYEKVDGVLQFFFNVTVRIQRELEKQPIQQKLNFNEEVEI